MASHVVALQTGSSTSEFNSNQWKINRSNMLIMDANRYSRFGDFQSTIEWCRIINCLEREFIVYANKDWLARLNTVRVTEEMVVLPSSIRGPRVEAHLSLVRKKLWLYETTVREIMDEKGFGATAKQDITDAMFDG